MTYMNTMNTRSAFYNTGTRSSTYNKTATYSTNARSTVAPRKTSYSLDLRKPTTYNLNTRAAVPYHTAGTSKESSQATTTYQMASSNSTVPNQVAAGTNTTQTTYSTNANLVSYNLSARQLKYGLPSVTLDLDTIAKLIAPQQVIYNMSTGAASVINSKATSVTTRPTSSQVPAFNTSAESTVPNIPNPRPPDPQMPTLNEVLKQSSVQKEAPSVITGCQIPASTKSTATELSSSSTTKQLSRQSGRFVRPATLKPASNAGTGNVFVKTRPNTVVRAELIKSKTTKRVEPTSSVSRTKDDEYKTSKKPKLAFKTKFVNKYCTYYHKYGRCKEGDFCAYKHDPNRVEVCKLWLKGSECTLGNKCPLQHVESARLIPHCRHFCKGMCLKDDCHYTHVKVSKRAPHCKEFMVGRYCSAGTDCRKKHEWGLYEEPTETEGEASKRRARDPAEEEVEREKIKKLREEMANGVNPFAAGWTFIPIDD